MAERIVVTISGDADQLVRESRRAGAAVTGLGRTVASQTRGAHAFNSVVAKQRQNLAALSVIARRAALVGFGALTAATIGAVKAAIDFESAFADVRKTVDASEPEFRKIEKGLRDLARQIPVSADELAHLAGEAGALGIASENIVEFTRTAAELGVATELSADEAANALARLSNIMGTSEDDFRRLGSTFVELGNKGASTEGEIAQMSLRLAATGKQVGLSEAQVLGFSSALASVGIRAQAGGSAFSRAFTFMAEAVEGGGKELEGFAEVAGMTSDEFKRAFEKDAALAMVAFTEGLGRVRKEGGSVFGVLEDLGLQEVRLRNALLSAAGAGDLFRDALKTGSEEWRRNTALTIEAEKRYKTAAAQLDLLKNSARDAAISLGDELLAEAQEFMPGIREAADEIADIFQQQDIGFEEKFTLSRQAAAEGLRPIVEAIDDLNLGDKAVDAFNDALPRLAEAAGKGAGKVAIAFAEGFARSDTFGKLALGALLISKMGLTPVIFRRAGAKAGAAAATGLASSTTTGGVIATGGKTMATRFTGALRGALRVAAPLAILSGLTTALADNSLKRSIGERFQDFFSGATFGLIPSTLEQAEEIVQRVARQMEGITSRFHFDTSSASQFKNSLTNIEFAALDLRDALDADFISLEQFKAGMRETRSAERQIRLADRVGDAIDTLANTYGRSFKDIERDVARNMRQIDRSMGKHSKEGKDAIADNFGAAIEAIRNTMTDKGPKAVERGNKIIDRLLQKQLRAFGISDPKAFLNRSEAEIGRLQTQAQANNRRQHGGVVAGLNAGAIVPGVGSGDTVPLHIGGQLAALVEPGELVSVANRTFTDALMRGNSDVPRKAAGGIVALGKQLQRQGFQVGEHPAFGGVSGVHTSGSFHDSGQAIDVNHDQGGEASALDRLHARLKNMPGVIELLWRVAGHFDHLHVAMAKGAAGALGGGLGANVRLPRFTGNFPFASIEARGLNQSARGLEAFAEAAMGSVEGAEGPALSGSGDVERVFANVSRQLSRSKTATLALGMAGFAESGMRDLAFGDASSQGALQLLASTAQALGVSPHDEAAIASLFYTRGFFGRGGANALAAQGLPAHLVAQSVQGSADSSGSNYLAQAGPAKSWMRRFGLKHGGIVQRLQGGGKTKSQAMSSGAAKLQAAMAAARDTAMRLRKTQGRVAKRDERVSIAEQLFGRETSAAGSGLSTGERAELVERNEALLEALERGKMLSTQGMRQARRVIGRKGSAGTMRQNARGLLRTFRDTLTDYTGTTGGGGRIFEVKQALNELRNPSDPTDAPGRLPTSVRGLQTHLAQLKGLIAKSNESITIADQLAALASSPAGSELSDSERANLVKLNEGLLHRLTVADKVARTGYLKTRALIHGGATGETRIMLDEAHTTFRQAMTDYRGVTGGGGDIFDVKLELARLRNLPTAESEREAQTAEILRSQLAEARQALSLSQAQFGAFSGFFRDFKLPFLGAFQQGIARVPQTGLAVLHRDEMVIPDPQGPAGTVRRVGNDSPVEVALYVEGDVAPLMRRVRAEVDGRAVQVVDQKLGRSARRLSLAPGG